MAKNKAFFSVGLYICKISSESGTSIHYPPFVILCLPAQPICNVVKCTILLGKWWYTIDNGWQSIRS